MSCLFELFVLSTDLSFELSKEFQFAIKNNNIYSLKDLKSKGVILSTDEIVFIIKQFKSVSYYEIFEYLLDCVELTTEIAYDLMYTILWNLKTPTTKLQQNIQLKIIKKLINYQTVKDELNNNNFDLVVESLNIPLVNFVIKELNITDIINELFHGLTALQWVVWYLIDYPNINNEFAYKMFDHLLTIGADINKRNVYDFDIFYYINRLTNRTFKNTLNKIITKHKTSINY